MDRSAFPLRRPLLLVGVLAACGTVADPLTDAPYGDEAPIEEIAETPETAPADEVPAEEPADEAPAEEPATEPAEPELDEPTIDGEPAPEDSVGGDLEDAVLDGDFRGHDFTGADLRNATFQGGSFAGAIFVDA
ncbi:MAG: pentapeptide repeat-containing protein, partial [Trueperaceae bacterium]|nr:pentapeptide repeat-containing protein [Trueperaceae bacterium]